MRLSGDAECGREYFAGGAAPAGGVGPGHFGDDCELVGGVVLAEGLVVVDGVQGPDGLAFEDLVGADLGHVRMVSGIEDVGDRPDHDAEGEAEAGPAEGVAVERGADGLVEALELVPCRAAAGAGSGLDHGFARVGRQVVGGEECSPHVGFGAQVAVGQRDGGELEDSPDGVERDDRCGHALMVAAGCDR